MRNTLLDRLGSNEFNDCIGFVLPASPLRRILQRSSEVRRLAIALRYGEITENDVRKFTAQLLKEFRSGEVFRHDIALGALAVAMEHWEHNFAEEYLIDLARLQRPEFRASFRVARECLKARYEFPKTEIRTSCYPDSGTASADHRPDPIRAMHRVGKSKWSGTEIQWAQYNEVSHACH
jgi:hypothetical protein